MAIQGATLPFVSQEGAVAGFHQGSDSEEDEIFQEAFDDGEEEGPDIHIAFSKSEMVSADSAVAGRERPESREQNSRESLNGAVAYGGNDGESGYVEKTDEKSGRETVQQEDENGREDANPSSMEELTTTVQDKGENAYVSIEEDGFCNDSPEQGSFRTKKLPDNPGVAYEGTAALPFEDTHAPQDPSNSQAMQYDVAQVPQEVSILEEALDSAATGRERPGSREHNSRESLISEVVDKENTWEIGYVDETDKNYGFHKKDKNSLGDVNSFVMDELTTTVEDKEENASCKENDFPNGISGGGSLGTKEVPVIPGVDEGTSSAPHEDAHARQDPMEIQTMLDGDAPVPHDIVLQNSMNENSDAVDSRNVYYSTQEREAINEVNSDDIVSFKHKDSSEIFYEPIEQALDGKLSSKQRDTLGIGENMEPLQGKASDVELTSQLNGKHSSLTEVLSTKDCKVPEAQLSAETQNSGLEHFKFADGSKHLKALHDVVEEDNGKNLRGDEEPVIRESFRSDASSREKHYESKTAPKNGTMGSNFCSSVASNTSHIAPAPLQGPPPAGLGSSASLLEPARVQQPSQAKGTVPIQWEGDLTSNETECDETREKLQMIRVKFLRLACRLGQTPHNVVVAQVLYRLGLAEQLRGSRNTSRTGAFNFDRASAMAEQLEASRQEPLGFSCTIMVIGKTGVGKSATINSIFDEVKFSTDAFNIGTKKVQEIVGLIEGIEVKIIDAPGLLSSCVDQPHNKKILHSLKNFIKKSPPDIVWYMDRLDMQSRDHGDLPLLRAITEIFGASIWFNAIVVLTHAACAPPDGPNGVPLSYEMIVTQRSQVVQQDIRQAAGDTRLMNPVSLVENHSACRMNRAGQRVLPNGQIWRTHLLLLSFASKILAEANTLLKLQDSPSGKSFGTRTKMPPLPFLLSSLLQSKPPLRLPEEQFGDDELLDYDLDEASDSDEESDYDKLPSFKRLTNPEVAKLSKEDKKAYFDELDYRELLFLKKQLKEEKRRRKLLRKMEESSKNLSNDYNENSEENVGVAASVPVPVPDMPLPNSFDSDYPTHRYRYLDNSNQWLVRPVLETHGWDHDVGYEGLNIERLFVFKDKIPVSISGQVTKDKKESSLQLDLNSSIKNGTGNVTSFGFDVQSVGKDMSYTLHSDLKFNSFRCNKTAAGFSVNFLGDALSAGAKVEDILLIYKRLRLAMSGGAMTNRGDLAYGGTFEATLRDKDHPVGQMMFTLGLSVMDWHRDRAIGWNLHSQFPVGRKTNMIARANLNNKGNGQISVRLNSSEHIQIVLAALVPLFQNIFRSGLFGSSQSMS